MVQTILTKQTVHKQRVMAHHPRTPMTRAYMKSIPIPASTGRRQPTMVLRISTQRRRARALASIRDQTRTVHILRLTKSLRSHLQEHQRNLQHYRTNIWKVMRRIKRTVQVNNSGNISESAISRFLAFHPAYPCPIPFTVFLSIFAGNAQE